MLGKSFQPPFLPHSWKAERMSNTSLQTRNNISSKQNPLGLIHFTKKKDLPLPKKSILCQSLTWRACLMQSWTKSLGRRKITRRKWERVRGSKNSSYGEQAEIERVCKRQKREKQNSHGSTKKEKWETLNKTRKWKVITEGSWRRKAKRKLENRCITVLCLQQLKYITSRTIHPQQAEQSTPITCCY